MSWKSVDEMIDEFERLTRFWRPPWPELWKLAQEIRTSLKETRYPSRDQREAAWKRFNALHSEASKRANKERDERRWQSERLRDQILRQVESARPQGGLVFTVSRESLKANGDALRKAGHMLSELKGEMQGEHKRVCFEAIQTMRALHETYWNSFRDQRDQKQRQWGAKSASAALMCQFTASARSRATPSPHA